MDALGDVFRDAGAIEEDEAEVALGANIGLFSGSTKPEGGFGRVLDDAVAGGVVVAEFVLGGAVAALSSHAEPAGGFGGVFCGADAGFKQEAKAILRSDVVLFDGLLVPAGSLDFGGRLVVAAAANKAQTYAGNGVAQFSAFNEFGGGLSLDLRWGRHREKEHPE